MTEFTSEKMAEWRHMIKNIRSRPVESGREYLLTGVLSNALDHIERLQKRIEELEAERRWIPVSNLPQKEEGECRLSIDVLLQPHPDASTLIAYYDFDDEKWIELQTACDIKVSSQGIWHTLPQLPKDGE